MNIEKLTALEDHAYKMSGYIADLVELELNPDLNIPAGFADRREYQLHLGNMIGSHRILLGNAYNAIEEWQNV